MADETEAKEESSSKAGKKGKGAEKKREYIAIGLGVLGIVIVLYEHAKSNAAAAAATTTGSGTNTGSLSTSPYGSSTGYSGWSGGSGESDLSSFETSLNTQLAQLTQQDTALTNTVTSQGTTISGLQSTIAGLTKPPTSQPASSVPSTASTPADSYKVGQVVGPGQTIVSSVLNSAKTGWYNLTSTGGVYTSGSAKLQTNVTGGSFLGYAASLPKTGLVNSQTEIAQHGNFSNGSISVGSNGTYTETNNQGEKYTF